MTQEINNECWRNISGYLNYQVSNVGRVRNSFTGNILKPNGYRKYYSVCLYNDKKRKDFQIHRLVAQEFIDNLDGKPCVDHIDHNVLNNCVNNLRWVSKSQNAMNMKKHKNTLSKYKGISFHKGNAKWMVRICKDGREKYLGNFDNEKQAAARYNEEAIKLFGEHALLNEISDDEDEEGTEDVDENYNV